MMIFEDPTRHRWRAAVALAIIGGVVVTLLVVGLVAGLFTNAPLTPLSDAPPDRALASRHLLEPEPPEPAATTAAGAGAIPRERPSGALATPLLPDRLFLRSAFIVQDDPRTISGLAAVLPTL